MTRVQHCFLLAPLQREWDRFKLHKQRNDWLGSLVSRAVSKSSESGRNCSKTNAETHRWRTKCAYRKKSRRGEYQGGNGQARTGDATKETKEMHEYRVNIGTLDEDGSFREGIKGTRDEGKKG